MVQNLNSAARLSTMSAIPRSPEVDLDDDEEVDSIDEFDSPQINVSPGGKPGRQATPIGGQKSATRGPLRKRARLPENLFEEDSPEINDYSSVS